MNKTQSNTKKVINEEGKDNIAPIRGKTNHSAKS